MVSIPSSFPGITQTEAIKLTDELCQIFFEAGLQFDLVTLHKVGKQFISLYFDCKLSRFELSEHLIKLKFLEFAVKVMKQLNNYGVFKGDDVWFATFYIYNLFWNYSEVNPEFASGLIRSGIKPLLISNITHDPYIDNLEKRNVNYLMKATLSICHNILRVPGNRFHISSDGVIKGLLKIASKDDKLSVLSTICLSYIACNDDVETTDDFDINYNVKLIFYYIKVATESNGKYNCCTMFDFLEVLKFGSLSKIQRDAIIQLDGIDVLFDQLKAAKEDRLKREILLTLGNLCDERYRSRISDIAGQYLANGSPMVVGAAKSLSWSLAIDKNIAGAAGDVKRSAGGKIFVNYAQYDSEAARRIWDGLGGLAKLPLASYEDDAEGLRAAIDEASAVLVCVSEAYRGTATLQTGARHCVGGNKIIFPALVQPGYKPDGWMREFVLQASDVFYDFSGELEGAWGGFLGALKGQLDALAAEEERSMAAAVSVPIQAIPAVPMPIQAVPAPPAIGQQQDILAWLASQNLTDLHPKLGAISMDMLLYLKTIRSQAPEFFFHSLEHSLSLSFVEILKLSAAIDTLG